MPLSYDARSVFSLFFNEIYGLMPAKWETFCCLLGQFDIFFFVVKVFDACLLLRWPLERILRLEDAQMPRNYLSGRLC